MSKGIERFLGWPGIRANQISLGINQEGSVCNQGAKEQEESSKEPQKDQAEANRTNHSKSENEDPPPYRQYRGRRGSKGPRKGHEKSKPARVRYLDLIKLSEETIRTDANEYQIKNAASMTKDEIGFQLFRSMVESEGNGLSASRGILEILQDGYGFLRTQMCTIDKQDVYVSSAQIKKLGLRTGDFIVGQTRAPKDSESYHALLRVECSNTIDPDKIRRITPFDDLVPLYPNQKFDIHVENKHDPSVRIVDLITPIGKGQRGLIVAPPKAGKTTLLKQLANALTENNPDLVLFVLLIDERPEEVTDMTRSVEGEVIASTFDQHLTNHIRVSEIVLERAKRLVEQGKDVVILLDSITRLARAYNIAVPSSGQTLSGGVNPLALYKPKKFFGSARNIEFGGSLTILATALVDTGSKMDDVIFEEFKGTGNMELHLDRNLFNKRVFPAINLPKSSTRREELLVEPDQLKGMTMLRRVFETLSAQEGVELLIKQMKTTKSNNEFLSNLQKQAGLTNN
jgi:transcription termination factor Rho